MKQATVRRCNPRPLSSVGIISQLSWGFVNGSFFESQYYGYDSHATEHRQTDLGFRFFIHFLGSTDSLLQDWFFTANQELRKLLTCCPYWHNNIRVLLLKYQIHLSCTWRHRGTQSFAKKISSLVADTRQNRVLGMMVPTVETGTWVIFPQKAVTDCVWSFNQLVHYWWFL